MILALTLGLTLIVFLLTCWSQKALGLEGIVLKHIPFIMMIKNRWLVVVLVKIQLHYCRIHSIEPALQSLEDLVSCCCSFAHCHVKLGRVMLLVLPNTIWSALKRVCFAFSALTLLVGWHPACKKTEWWGAGVVVCLQRGADLHMAQLMPLPLTVSCFSKIQIGFTFLGPAHLGSPGQTAVKRVCVLS